MAGRQALTVRWLVVAATLWAAFSRFYHLATLPPQAWVDEIWFALRARELVQTGRFQVFYRTFWGGVHPFLVDLTAAVQVLGFGKVIVASRAVSAVCGVLSIPLAYACFDEFWRDREAGPAPWGSDSARARGAARLTAALTALILSNLLYTVAVSRVGTEPAVALAAGLFCIWQLRRAQRNGHWARWAVAGLAAGLAQYISPHARFILPLLGFLGLHDLVLSRPDQRRSRLLGLSLLACAAVLIALPLIAFFIREPEWFFTRARAVAVVTTPTGARFLLENLRLIVLSFSLRGDLNPRHNLPGRPMFDGIQSLGFWAGMVWAGLWVRRSAPARDLLAWAGIMVVPSLLTDGAPQFERMIGFAPPAAALIAVGWVALWQWAQARWKRAAGASAALLILVSLGLNTYDYFARYPASPALAAAMTATPVVLARQLIERARTEPVFVERIPEADDVLAFDFLFPGTPVRRLDFRQCLPLADRRTARTTYLVLAERDPGTVEALTRAFPTAALQTIRPESAALMREAALIEVPPGTPMLPVPNPVSARFEPGITLLGVDWSGPTVKPGESVFLTLYWKAERDFNTDLTTFLHVGTGLAGSRNVAQHDGQPCQGLYPTSLWRAGDVVPDGFAVTILPGTPEGDYPLAVGWYRYPSLERLPLASADVPLSDNRAVIATLTVTAP